MTKDTKELLPTLKPCPFCGGEAHYELTIVNNCVRCGDCSARVTGINGGDSKPILEDWSVTFWNTRTPPAPDDVVERIFVPVVCQNGHEATGSFVWDARRIEFVWQGAKNPECTCSKMGLGEGWKITGKPFVHNATLTQTSTKGE